MQEVLDIEHNLSNLRGSCPDGLSGDLLELIRKEMNLKRQLPLIDELGKNDIVLKQIDPAYVIARLKHFLKTVIFDPLSCPLEPINYE